MQYEHLHREVHTVCCTILALAGFDPLAAGNACFKSSYTAMQQLKQDKQTHPSEPDSKEGHAPATSHQQPAAASQSRSIR